MNLGIWKKRFKHLGYVLPFTVYFLLFSLLMFVGFKWLFGKTENPDSSFAAVFDLMIRLTLAFSVIILVWGFLTVLISWLYCYIQIRKKSISLNLETPENNNDALRQKVGITLKPILKPLFGFVRVRLIYNDEINSSKFSLVTPFGSKIFSKSIVGFFNWDLPDVKEYSVNKIIVYLEDLFQFFSFTFSLQVPVRFTTSPKFVESDKMDASPRKTEETSIRIEELKRVEGEFLNYKDFETNDDVRRIVWKIYAKNKELVVRIPEIMDPYASHVYMFPSFYSTFDIFMNESINAHFINYYKSACWTIFENLVSKGFVVKYSVDNQLSYAHIIEQKKDVKQSIAKSVWHNTNPLSSFVDRKAASVVIVSSLCDVADLEKIINEKGNEISFVFVKLSDSIKSKKMKDWFRWVFVEDPDSASLQKTAWKLFPLHYKIMQNEQNIEKILKQFDKSSVFKINELKA
ncbi:MAG: DUF58 domain-containing protein [Sphingobacteriaceae bacterium]|nr:DUF58 domain-containing protein [Sphingobacteriaceae bacterium]